jgi:hypothetical protein
MAKNKKSLTEKNVKQLAQSMYQLRTEASQRVGLVLQLVEQPQTGRHVAQVVLQPQVRLAEVLGVADNLQSLVLVLLQPLNLTGRFIIRKRLR